MGSLKKNLYLFIPQVFFGFLFDVTLSCEEVRALLNIETGYVEYQFFSHLSSRLCAFYKLYTHSSILLIIININIVMKDFQHQESV